MFHRKPPGGKPPAFSFKNVESSRAKPAVVSEAVRQVLRDDDFWATIEPYLLPPGICGSKNYDQANVVRDLLEWDEANNNGTIAGFGLSDRHLWGVIYRELPKAGFLTSHGRIIGLLEDRSETDDNNNSDIE